MLAVRPRNRVLLPPMTRARRPAGAIVHTLSGQTMGTTWCVKLAAPALDRASLDRAIRRILDEVVGQMSPWEAQSDLNRFNAAAPGSWTSIPPAFNAVLACALEIAEATDGAFDPTLGALVDLWGFGPAPRAWPVPPAPFVEVVRACSGWRRLRLDDGRLLQPGGLKLDLCGIAKGYAVDRVAEALEAAGIASFLIEIGGELRGAGLKPDGEPWWVELEAPPEATSNVRTLLAACDMAVATSGGYRRFFEADGRRFSHTLDPRSGTPVNDGVLSVSAVHPSCMQADALATALTVLGPEAALTFCDRHAIAALVVTASQDGGTDEQMSAALSAML
jgi:thiamine biosynthesis lipoprotein